MTIHNFIKKRPYLVWYTKNLEHLSDGAIVESVLNYIFQNMHKQTVSQSITKQIDYSEEVIYIRGFEIDDEVVKKELIDFSLIM